MSAKCHRLPNCFDSQVYRLCRRGCQPGCAAVSPADDDYRPIVRLITVITSNRTTNRWRTPLRPCNFSCSVISLYVVLCINCSPCFQITRNPSTIVQVIKDQTIINGLRAKKIALIKCKINHIYILCSRSVTKIPHRIPRIKFAKITDHYSSDKI